MLAKFLSSRSPKKYCKKKGKGVNDLPLVRESARQSWQHGLEQYERFVLYGDHRRYQMVIKWVACRSRIRFDQFQLRISRKTSCKENGVEQEFLSVKVCSGQRL